jgi:crotonobetainyl-CoA:carnitine CoA-transferase CaiB-like acyl-CoA transferase
MPKQIEVSNRGPCSDGPLSHLFVLDLADDKGSFCARLLADLGAAVIKVESPDGDLSRKSDPEAFLFDNINKDSIVIDIKTHDGCSALKSLLKRADVLLESFDPGSIEAAFFEPQRLRRINPGLVHISITPFVRSDSSTNPLELPGCQPFRTASLFAAIAVLIHLRKRKVTGKGSHLDVSIHEAVASMLEGEFARYFYPDSPGTLADWNEQIFSVLRCRDGYVQIPISRCRNALAELMASDHQTVTPNDGKRLLPSSPQAPIRGLQAAVEAWTERHTRYELVELGQAMGFPWASVDSIEETHENPQLQARRFFSRVPHSNGLTAITLPGLPYKFSHFCPGAPQTAPALGQNTWARVLGTHGIHATTDDISEGIKRRSRCADGTIFAGMRVLDLTRMISGPYATRIFADFGAEVIKIQSAKASTGAERNDSPQFAVWNRNKRSIILDLDQSDARHTFLRLVANSDIVLENYSPRVMANWGLGYERLQEVNPALVMVSISAMGHTGPWKDFVGFAPSFHAFSGLMAAVSGSCPRPSDIGYPYADLVTGLYAALAALAAVEFKNRTGKGQHVDLSALEAICTFDPRFSKRQSGSSSIDLKNDEYLAARRFFISSTHPVHGKVLASRTPLWDWRRKPRWKASPRLGEDNRLISDPVT